MNIFKKYKSEIIISFVTGVFFIYAERLFSLLGNFFVDTYLIISESFSNDYYKSMALNNSSSFDEFNGLILILFFSFCLIALIISLNEKKKKLKKSISKSLEKISQNKENLQGVKKDEKMTKEEMIEFLSDSESRFKDLETKLDKNGYLSYIIMLTTSLSIIALATNFAVIKSVNNQNIQFENDLMKIAPYTSSHEIDLLKANWAGMHNSKDFELIQKKLKIKKNQYKIH